MFGMGFMEIFLIAIVAIVALGPDKLPTAMVEVAKFFKKFKSGVEDAKSTLDNELNISEMKEEAAKFQAQIENTKSSVTNFNEFDLGVKNILEDDSDEDYESNEKEDKTKEINKPEEKKEQTNNDNTNEQKNPSDKFKVKKKKKKEEDN